MCQTKANEQQNEAHWVTSLKKTNVGNSKSHDVFHQIRLGPVAQSLCTIQYNTIQYSTHIYLYVWVTVASTGVCLFIRGNCVNIGKIHFYSIFVHISCRCVFLSTGRCKTFVQTMAHCHIVDTYLQRDIHIHSAHEDNH